MPIELHVFDPDPERRPERKQRLSLPDFLRADELAALFQAARSLYLNTLTPAWKLARKRDWVMVQAAYYCGLRVAELCALELEDLDLEGRLLMVRKGKGAKDRSVPIAGKLWAVLRDWVGERTSTVLFPDPRGGHVTTHHVRSRVRVLARRAGILRRCHPHLLRHSCACALLRGGATIYEVKQFLGHSSLQTTCLYLHLEPGRLREVTEFL